MKDIMAMANTAGGYILIGVDNAGNPVGCEATLADRIDEAVVRAQVSGYTSARIPIFVNNQIQREDLRLVVITVLPVQATIVVAEADGNVPSTRPVFRKGDVLVRHGSAGERWNQADVEFVVGRIVATRKEQWLKEFGGDLGALLKLLSPGLVPVGPETFDVAPEQFQTIVTDLLRGGNG